MSTEISMLDMVEKGESHGGFVEGHPRQACGEDTHRTFEPMVPSPSSVDQAQDKNLGKEYSPIDLCLKLTFSDLEQVTGPEGLARVKDYDRRFAFYPSFSVERSLALEFRAQRISRLSTEIQTLRRELKSEDGSEPTSNLAPTGLDRVAEERLEGLMSRLADSLAQYGGENFQ